MAATCAWPSRRVARGNGKTGLIAGLVCCHLFGPEAEPRGEIYSAACNTKQAALVFAEVEAIINAVPEFEQFRIKATSFWKRMEVKAGPGKGTVYAVLSGEKEAAHGLAPTLVDIRRARHCARTGNCSTRCRRQAASATAPSASPSRPKRLTTGTPSPS